MKQNKVSGEIEHLALHHTVIIVLSKSLGLEVTSQVGEGEENLCI